MWTNAINTEYDHNFAKYPLTDEDQERSRLLHRRIDVDYNGWWMCMIPRQVAEELGQPLPLFIKWDDAEYGLRAGEHGYPTVTLPGTAIWHMAWSDKDDAIDWQAYFHLRNRLVVAAMHWDGNIRGLIASHLKATIKHLLCLEYSTVAIQNKAMDDFLAGPEHIFSILESALPEVRRMRQEYPDAVVLPSATALPAPSDKRWRKKVRDPDQPGVDLGAAGPRRRPSAQAARPGAPRRPQINVATQDARWFSLCRVDGVTVTTADGRGVVYRQRDRAKMFELLRESLKRQALLARKFNRMRQVYRDALPVLTSTQKWETCCFRRGQRSDREVSNGPGDADARAARTPCWWPCSRALAERPGVLPVARGMSHFGEHSLGLARVSRARRAAAATAPPRLAHRGRRARSSRTPRPSSSSGSCAGSGRTIRRSPSTSHPEPAELPVGARHVDDRGRSPAGRARPGCRWPRCWCRRWRCPAWCSACTIRATC